MTEPAHSPVGPSGAERWMNCTRSVDETKDMPNVSSKYAAEGTAAHTLSEWCRNDDKPAEHYLGARIEVEGFEFFVTREMADNVQEFVDWCEDVPGYGFYEMRVRYDRWIRNGFGTSDDIRVSDGVCTVTDLKYGKGHQVFAENNPQLKLYALGTYEALKHLFEFDKIVIRVCQPRLSHFDVWETTIEDLLHWANTELIAAGKEIEAGGKFKAGPHCSNAFCLKRFDCAERAKWVAQQVTEHDSDFEDLDAAIATMDDTSPVEFISLDALSRCLSVADAVATWVKDIKARAMREIQAGHDVGDWKLVEGRSRRTWAYPEEEIVEALEDEGGLTNNQVYKRKLISPAQAEKLIGKKHILMAECVKKPPGKPKLAPGSDKRQPMSLAILREFEDLGDEKKDDDEDDY